MGWVLGELRPPHVGEVSKPSFSIFDRILWTSDQHVARPLPTQVSITQKDEDKHPCLQRDSNPRSHYPSGQDPRPRPRGHCDRHQPFLCTLILNTESGAFCRLHRSNFNVKFSAPMISSMTWHDVSGICAVCPTDYCSKCNKLSS
jgi:hypothetical protein